MPAFTAVGAYVAGTLLGLVGTAALVVGAVVATGAAYITSRIINGNQNKGNNSAGNQGGRIQVPPATNNKIPVLYGSAYVNGIITDARLKSLGGTTNDTMYYCLVLSEYTNNLVVNAGNFIVGQKYTISVVGTTNFTLIGAASNTVGVTFTATGVGTGTGQARYNSVYGLESVVWNDLRLTPVDATTNAHKVKDGRKVVDGAIFNAGSFVVGSTYVITEIGNTDFIAIGSQTNNIGQIFTATGVGTGSGKAQIEDFIDTNFVVDSNSLVELRVYAGGSSAAEQIYPPQASSNTQAAYDFWGNDDNSWTDQYAMDGLVFAIVKLTYNGDKGFTSLPNVTFQLANNLANPADVWLDYMTSERYGAGIAVTDIDLTANASWAEFCEEDINYTNVAGETNQSTLRYNINGLIDTSNQVKTNIDTILQNGGAWMSYDVSTGLWSPVIKKAINAGTATDAATLFTASRTGTTLTIPLPTTPLPKPFPSGRIEAGQLLYNSTGTLIGTITAQLFPLDPGETTGQIGRYTVSGAGGTITTTTFYTLPASSLEFSDDNIISGITISSTRLEDLYNSVEAEFYNRYNKDQRAYARNYLDAGDRNPNEPDNQLRMSLDLVNNSMQADILGQMEMRQSRDDLVIDFTSTHYGIQAQAGDVIAVTSELYGWAPKYFRVMRVKEIENEDATLTAQIQALEYNPDVYTIEPITEFSTAANIKIGNLISSPGLPKPTTPLVDNENPNDSVPNFRFNINVPATGGPFDEAEVYVAEGWDPNAVTGWIDNNSTPGTYSGVAGTIMTVTAVTYNSINVGDYFDLGGVTVVNQLTQTTISTKTFASGGAVAATTFTLNNVTGVVIGQKPTGTGIPSGAMVIGVSGTTVTLDKAFTVQATGNYLFTTAGGTGTYTVNISTAVNGTDDLFDQPIDSDFRYLKKIVPDGNAAAFTSGSTISTTVTELKANSQTFRRYFLKARLGVKKNFGEFSPNTPVDIDGNSIPWQPNPVGGGGGGTGAGVFTSVDINNTTPWLTFSTQPDGANPQYGIRGKSTIDDPWFIGAGSTGNDQGYIEIATADNAGDPFGDAGPIYARQYNGYAGTGAPWFGGDGVVVNEFTLLDEDGNTIIPNNLTVDSGTLFVDATNNRVGINNTSPAYTLDVSGNAYVSQDAIIHGDLTVNGTTSGGVVADIVTNNTSGAIFNTNATTLDIGGVATTLNMGATTGTMTIGNPTVRGTQVTQNVFNTVATTVNAFGAATTTNIGSTAGGTTTIGWDAVVNKDLAVNGGDITTTQTTASLFNTTATTLNIGSASTATRIGATTGTTTIGYNLNLLGPTLTLNSDDTTGDFDPNIVFADDGVNPAVIVWDSSDNQFSFSKPIFTVTDKDITSSGNFVLDRSIAGVYASDNATIRVDRAGGLTDATITWNEATDKWNISNSVTVSSDLNASSLTSNTINSTTAPAITLSGADVTVEGNLNVKGTTLTLNSDGTGTEDITILFERAASDTYIKYNESTDRFEFNSPITTLNNLGARFSQDLFGTGYHGVVIAGATGSMVLGGDFYFQRQAGTAAGTNASIYVDRVSPAVNSYITWNETTDAWDISNDTNVVANLILTGNTIKSSGGTTALTLSGADVVVAGTLTLTGNTINSSGGTTALTLSGDDVTIPGNLKVDAVLLTGSSEDVANAGAMLLTKAASYFSTGATGETSTLAAGTEGQFKSMMMRADGGGDMVVTVSNAGWKSGSSGTITFSAVGHSCLLQYINSRWYAVGQNGVTFA
jgi:hypothetical protein